MGMNPLFLAVVPAAIAPMDFDNVGSGTDFPRAAFVGRPPESNNDIFEGFDGVGAPGVGHRVQLQRGPRAKFILPSLQVPALLHGSGAITTSNNNSLTHHVSASSEPANSDIINAINFITNTFGLTSSELATVLGVARSTIYTWRGNTTQSPRRETMRKLYDLNLAAQNWIESDYANPSRYMHRPILQGKTLIDFLSATSIDQEALDHIGRKITLRSGFVV